MKKSIFKLALILLMIPQIGFSSTIDQKHEKTKTLKKAYDVSRNATVDIENKYGNITVISWDKNRVEITVEITVKGSSLSAVEKRLEAIDVDFNGNSSYVKAKTIIEKKSSWGFWSSSSNVNYQINYTVKMPKDNNIKLNNDYGSIIVDEINGKTDINCDYGKIIVGSLNNTNNNINLDYCSASTINYLKNGDLNIDYSKLTVDKAYDVSVNADYSTLNFGKINGIEFNGDYGSISVDEVRNIVANTDYVSVKIGTVYNNLKLESDYGSIKVAELADGFSNAYINAEYTGISIGTKSTNNFQFIIDLSYAGFSYDKGHVDLYKSIEKSTKKYYEGVYGKGSNKAKLTIKSEFGSVKLKD